MWVPFLTKIHFFAEDYIIFTVEPQVDIKDGTFAFILGLELNRDIDE